MKVLITGGGGFLGQHLISDVLACGKHEVYAMSSQKEVLNEKFGQSGHFKVVDSVPGDLDVLISCAFPRNADGLSLANGLDYISALYKEAVCMNVKSVVNISSQSVYSSQRQTAADESEAVNLESKYAVGKYAVELLTNSIFSGIPHTNIRMASLIGVGFDQRITNKFVKQVVAGNDLRIVGGRQQYGFLDVRDAASAIIKVALADPAHWDEVYNLGTDGAYTLEEIANCVVAVGARLFGKNASVQVGEEAPWFGSALDSSRLKKQLGWEPKLSLEEIVCDIFRAEVDAK